MQIELKGIHWTLAKLTDGSTKIYWYAWKNGPRIHGEYGTPEFVASYNAAIAQRAPTPEGKLQSLLDGYQRAKTFSVVVNAPAQITCARSRSSKRSSVTFR